MKKSRVLFVTDHALVRWMERVHGIDFTSFRNEIATTCDDAFKVGASKVMVDGFTYVIDGNSVRTVVEGHYRVGVAEQRRRIG
jgi:hypothetical protein